MTDTEKKMNDGGTGKPHPFSNPPTTPIPPADPIPPPAQPIKPK